MKMSILNFNYFITQNLFPVKTVFNIYILREIKSVFLVHCWEKKQKRKVCSDYNEKNSQAYNLTREITYITSAIIGQKQDMSQWYSR